MCGTRQQTAIVVWGHHLQVPTLTQVMLLSEDFWAIFSRIPYPQWLLSLVLSTCPNPNFLPLTPWMHGLLTLFPVYLLPLEFQPESVFTKWAHNRSSSTDKQEHYRDTLGSMVIHLTAISHDQEKRSNCSPSGAQPGCQDKFLNAQETSRSYR